jgi:agmatinase
MERPVYNNFLGLAPDRSGWERSRACIIQAPLENTTSFQQGTSAGPQAILKASEQVELYDIASATDFSEIGITTFAAPDLRGLDNESALKVIESDVMRALEKRLWPIVLGGEHTVSFAPIRALARTYHNISVLQIDAHADLRNTYEGSAYSHACVMRRVVDMGIPVVGVGIRNYSAEEAEFIRENKSVIFHDTDIERHGLDPSKISAALTENVYITVDIDGFDPSECPGTGTPEPNGLRWAQAMTLFKTVFKNHNVIGMDVNEVMPISGDARTEFFAAKLIYKMIGFQFFPEKTCR